MQFSLLAIIILLGHFFTSNSWIIIIQLAGIAIGLWGIAAMKIQNLSVSPLPKQNATFINSGPYHLIRNPMYLGILLFTIPLVITRFSWGIMVCEILLILDLGIKIAIEEKLLMEKFPKFSEYKQKTWRLIPFII